MADTLVTIRVDGEGGGTACWSQRPSPWPGLPIAYGADSPGSDRMGFRCCDGGDTALIAAVVLHLPEPGKPAFTVELGTSNATVEHLIERHGFIPGDESACSPRAGYHATPHRNCILRTV
jgi:hypothetical protein